MRTLACDSVFLLSQYIGDLQPEAQVKGSFGWRTTALICNKNSATFNAETELFIIEVAQKYKVFINNRAVFFQDNIEPVDNTAQYSMIKSDKISEIEEFIKKNSEREKPICVVGENVFEKYFSTYRKIEAAGGVVVNSNQEILFILRLGKWDLPKGKLEINEKIEDAAIREVEEECGVNDLSIIKQLTSSYHTYTLREDYVLKTTYWFLMQTNFSGKLVPQIEEDIERVEWMTLKNAKKVVFPNTYGAIIDLIDSFES